MKINFRNRAKSKKIKVLVCAKILAICSRAWDFLVGARPFMVGILKSHTVILKSLQGVFAIFRNVEKYLRKCYVKSICKWKFVKNNLNKHR